VKTFLPFLFTYLFCFSINTTAQNLVPNPSFEQLNANPKRGDITIACSKDWFASYMMGTDYFNRSSVKGTRVPKNNLGYQEPHSGDA
jgi:hypothetical protein